MRRALRLLALVAALMLAPVVLAFLGGHNATSPDGSRNELIIKLPLPPGRRAAS